MHIAKWRQFRGSELTSMIGSFESIIDRVSSSFHSGLQFFFTTRVFTLCAHAHTKKEKISDMGQLKVYCSLADTSTNVFVSIENDTSQIISNISLHTVYSLVMSHYYTLGSCRILAQCQKKNILPLSDKNSSL